MPRVPRAPTGRTFPEHLPRVPRVPEAHTESHPPDSFRECHVSRKPTPRATLRIASESATCPGSPHRGPPSRYLPSVPPIPEAHTERHPPDTFRVCHVSRKPTPRATLRIPSEYATCPGSPHREPPSECLPSVPLVPKASRRETLRKLFEYATCPESLAPRDP